MSLKHTRHWRPDPCRVCVPDLWTFAQVGVATLGISLGWSVLPCGAACEQDAMLQRFDRISDSEVELESAALQARVGQQRKSPKGRFQRLVVHDEKTQPHTRPKFRVIFARAIVCCVLGGLVSLAVWMGPLSSTPPSASWSSSRESPQVPTTRPSLTPPRVCKARRSGSGRRTSWSLIEEPGGREPSSTRPTRRRDSRRDGQRRVLPYKRRVRWKRLGRRRRAI